MEREGREVACTRETSQTSNRILGFKIPIGLSTICGRCHNCGVHSVAVEFCCGGILLAWLVAYRVIIYAFRSKPYHSDLTDFALHVKLQVDKKENAHDEKRGSHASWYWRGYRVRPGEARTALNLQPGRIVK